MSKVRSFGIAFLLLLCSVSATATGPYGPPNACRWDTGYIVCGASCHWNNVCVSDAQEPAYCFYYFEPDGCFHDGQYDRCCDENYHW